MPADNTSDNPTDVSVDYRGLYSVMATTFVVFSVKDRVLLRLWDLGVRLKYNTVCFRSSAADSDDLAARRKQIASAINLISDFLFTQALAWTTIYYILSTSLLKTAFHPLMSEWTLVILSVNIGRLMYQCYVDSCVKCHPWRAGHSLLVSVCCLAFVMTPGSFSAIALIGVGCEAAHFHRPIEKLLNAAQVNIYHRRRLVNLAAGLVLTLTARGVFPLVAVVMAVVYGVTSNVNVIDPNNKSHLTLFTIYFTYLVAVNIFLSVTVVYKFREIFLLRRLHLASQCHDHHKSKEIALDNKPTVVMPV